MPKLIRPPDKADVTLFLRMLFLRTERDIVNEITRKRTLGYVDYAEVAALERIQRILKAMVDESWSYVPAEEKSSMDAALAAEILKKVRPAVAAISDEKQRNAVADALIASVMDKEGDIAKILQTVQKNAQKAVDSSQKMDVDAIQKAYDKFNPHRKEQQ